MLERNDPKQALLHKRVAACVNDFAPLPSVAMRLMEMVSDAETMAADLETVLKGDISLVAAVLKLANSAFYGLRRQVVSLKHALTILGKSEVQNMVVARVMFRAFQFSGSSQRTLVVSVWKHSLECGLAAEYMAERNQEEGGAFFLGGMLHDIGKLLIACEFSKEIEGVENYGQLTGVQGLEVEREILGCGHDELGAQLLYRWMFPVSLVQVVAGHHDYEKIATQERSCQILILADLLSKAIAVKDWEYETGKKGGESEKIRSQLLRCGAASGIIADEQELESVELAYRQRLEERVELLDLLMAC